MRFFRFLLLLLLLLLTTNTVVLAMTKREALKELGLKAGADEKDIKKAYRKRSLETHPDKGGSNEEFVRVAEAYQILTGTADESSGTGGSGFGFNMSDEDKVRMANELFLHMLDDFLVDSDVMADKVVDWLFDMFADAEVSETKQGKTTYTFNNQNKKKKETKKKKKTPEVDSYWKSIVRWMTRKAVKYTQSILEGDNMEMTINGQKITGADIKRFREQAQQRVDSKNSNNQQKTKTKKKGEKSEF